MLTVYTHEMELRGIQSQVSKKGNSYYLIHCEDIDNFEAYKFVCREFEKIPSGLKKGDLVRLTLGYNSFKELSVLLVEKAG